jgi:uncharacterized protein (TIGR02001 family)
MEFKRSMMSAALLGAAAFSGVAAAGVTGNVGAFSSYMFRGVDQAGTAVVQGGLDVSSEGGLYAGTWVSTLAGGAYETDLYAGFSKNGFDVGYIFYGYRDGTKANMSEVYAGYSAAGFSGKVYFSPEFSTTEDEAFYVTGSYAFALSDSLSLTPQVGYSFGDGIETLLGTEDSYLDYSLTLAKTLEGGLTFTFGVYANSEDDILGKEQLVVGLKKAFDL